jgi:hypothetical protein
MSGTGAFGSFATTLFVNDNGMFTWRGEEELNGRRMLRYDYRVPVMLSGWNVRTLNASGIAGMKGSIWVDPVSLDLVRMEVNGDDVPLDLKLDSVSVTVDYARTRIGSKDVMLPQTGEIHMLHVSREESKNLMEFTHCREFRAESTLSFAQSTVSFGEAVIPRVAVALELPPGLTINVKLAAAITEKDAVGDLVHGVVSGNVVQGRKVVVADGSQVSGRIRRMERHQDNGGYYAVGIEFTEIRTGDLVYRFFADFRSGNRGVAQELPGVATVFLEGRLNLPVGFLTVWRTR